MILGVAGAHRVGKTTFAKDFADAGEATLMVTSASEVFKAHGLDPAAPMDFKTRLYIQRHILDHVQDVYSCWKAPYKVAITDRTPIDMMAYTLAEVQSGTIQSSEVEAELEKYLDDCWTVAQNHLGAILVIQPGIPLIQEEGKARADKFYIEHLNSLICSLVHREDFETPSLIMKRHVVGRNDRVRLASEALAGVAAAYKSQENRTLN